jgi:hypothetical protein
MPKVAAQPVTEGLYALLQDPSVLAVAAGGVQTDAMASPTLPFLWLEYLDETDRRGLGTGGLPEVRLRTHAFSSATSLLEAQTLNAAVVNVLKDAAIAATGYQQAGLVVYHASTLLRDQILNGVKVHEFVSEFSLWVEEQ